MTMPSPSVFELLTDLQALGVELQLHGDAIRFRPRSALTLPLLQRLQASKAELLPWLDANSAVAELRRFVADLWKDHAWRQSWEHRFREAKYANLDSLRSVLGIVIDLAKEHHQRRDWKAFASACKYLQRFASGEDWDKAALLSGVLPSNLTVGHI